MWIEDEDAGRLGADVIRIIIVESGICLDVVLEEGVRASRGMPCVVVVGQGTKALRVSIGRVGENISDSDGIIPRNGNTESVRLKIDKSNQAFLSNRETEVLSHISVGETNKEIARKMNISDETVRGHIKSIFRKTGMENRTQAALWALSRHASTSAGE